MEIDASDEINELRSYLSHLRRDELVEFAINERRERRQAERDIRFAIDMADSFKSYLLARPPAPPMDPPGPRLVSLSDRLRAASGDA